MRQRWRVRTSVLETERNKEFPFKTEVAKKILICKRRRGRQRMFFTTRTSALRDRGEDRASFKTEAERKFLMCMRRICFLRPEVHVERF